MTEWFVLINQQQVGPTSEQQLLAWVSQGTVGPSTLMWCQGLLAWTPAVTLFPTWFGQVPPAMPNALVPGGMAFGGPPHRGGTILTLGILSLATLLFCYGLPGVIMGAIAWKMGNRDLQLMDASQMDPSGRGNTRAGRICGMIGFWVGLVVLVGMIIFYAALFSTDGFRRM